MGFASESLAGYGYQTTATYYHDYYIGRPMSNGKIFRQDKLTAAHSYIKLGTKVKVYNLKNNKNVEVTITDRCRCRSIDLTTKAFLLLVGKGNSPKNLSVGRLPVKLEY